jgi:hypothetical protein
MACCAFAVFLLGQALFGLERVRELLFGPAAATPPRISRSAAWRPGAAAPDESDGRGRASVVAPAVIAMEIGLLAIGAGGWMAWSNLVPSQAGGPVAFCRAIAPGLK